MYQKEEPIMIDSRGQKGYDEAADRICRNVTFKCAECDAIMAREIRSKGLVFTCTGDRCFREIVLDR